MADALGVCLNKLRSHYVRYSCSYRRIALDYKKLRDEQYDRLAINQIRKMMLGYESDNQVCDLLNKMEGVVASHFLYIYYEDEPKFWLKKNILSKVEELINIEACYGHEKSLMDQKLENLQAKVKEILDNEACGNLAEIVMDLVKVMWYNHLRYMQGKESLDKMIIICEKLCTIRFGSNVEEEAVVGFNEEVETLLDQLTGTSNKQFQIISITGMAGLGKTTLARKLYSHPLIEYMFDYRAWICVSQVFLKKDLLFGILRFFVSNFTEEIYKMSDEQLGEKLYRLLKGRKYLVVLDDIWDCKAWNDLKIYFPDDKTGSRVLLTTRDVDMSLQVQAARPAHVLRLRTEVESWDIFMKKMFRTGVCPILLEGLGRVITRKCEGLPLAIVMAAGLLRNDWSKLWWMQIAESLSSFMVSDPSQYMDSLALSYNYLPPHLRPCFLFFGSFPEDYDVPVTKLIWLWIAQGFIHETDSRILEDIAEDCLMNLIKRCLVMASKNGADGRIKSCRIHDLLRDFCLRKAKEENICLLSYKQAAVPVSYPTTTDTPPLPTHSGLCYPFELGNIFLNVGSVVSESYKSLRILDMEYVPLFIFPSDVIQLVNLRYLAFQAYDGSPHLSISNLVNLQTLIISSTKNIVLPKTMWNMVNLRHIYIKSGENQIEDPTFVQLTEKDGCPIVLASLQTLSQVSPRSCKNISSGAPSLRKLGFCGPLLSSRGELEFPNIGFLPHLRNLKLLNTIPFSEATRSCNPIMFPESLKKLTLSNTGINWKEMWTFAWLPNLEILKLKFHACIGERWETGYAEFRKLKVLKLHDLDFKQWVSSRDNFPRLQRLAIHRCLKLNSIPLDLGKILTLDVIEVSGCSTSAHNSALEIHKQQESEGNFFLKVHANPDLEIQKEQ